MSVPPGLPPDARQVSLDELKNMAKLDPSLERLYQEVLKVGVGRQVIPRSIALRPPLLLTLDTDHHSSCLVFAIGQRTV